MIKYNLNNIKDWNYGDDNIKKVYYHNSICYQKISKGEGETYNLFGKTKSSSPFTIKLNGVDETVTIVKDNGDGTYDWGLKYSNPITATTNMCYGNTSLISFNWGDADVSSLTSIGNTAFLNCSSLTSVTIPSSVTSIGSSAFERCSGLASVTIPSGVTSIGYRTFWNCSSIASVIIPSGVTTIESQTFDTCSSLTNITIPNSVTRIDFAAFRDCSGLTNVTLGSGLTNVGEAAFDRCSRLTSVTIPDSVTSIGQFAFYKCTSLTSLTIGIGIREISYAGFQNCPSLTSITINRTTPPSIYNKNVFYNTNNCPIYVPAESVDAYKSAGGWSNLSDRIFPIQ